MPNATSLTKCHTITDVSERFGLTLRSLRFYEEKGLLSPIRKGVHRIYSAEDLVRIQMILVGKRLGFSLSELKKFMERKSHTDETSDAFGDLGLSKAEVEQQIDSLVRQRDELDETIAQLRNASSNLAG